MIASLPAVRYWGIIRCAAQGNRIVAADQQRTCKGNGAEGVGGWQPILKGLVNTPIYNYGNSGEQSGEIAARLSGILNSRSSTHVLVLAGTNDAIRGSVSAAVANIKSMVTAIQANGRIAVVGTLPPINRGDLPGTQAKIDQINQQIRAMPASYSGLIIADIYASVAPNWAQNHSGDAIHFGAAGNQLVATAWAKAINQSLQTSNNAASIAPVISILIN